MPPESRRRAPARLAACSLLLAAGCGGGSDGGSGDGSGAGSGGNPGGGTGGGATPPPATTADFRDEIVYQVLTDRFANGDAGNDGGQLVRPGDAADRGNPVGWHGGDFAGIRRRIEEGYFQRMGFTAIWISPVVLQVSPPGNGGGVNSGRPFVGFHGYWADRFDVIEPHFGDLESLRSLGAAADAEGIKLVVDVVVNHVGPGSTLLAQQPTWFRTGGQCGNDEVTMCLAGLPDFRQETTAVTDFLVGTTRWLRENVPSVDGVRMDTMKHVGDAFWAQYLAAGSPADARSFWTVGEVFDGSVARISHYLDTVGSPSVFDFPLKFALTDSLARGGSTWRIADVLAQDTRYRDPTRLSVFLDNHDVWRFASEAEAAGATPAEADRRLDLALTVLYTLRGTPVVYYGTEIAMRGRGDSYDLPIGASSREDMDFARLDASGLDERLKVLADLRRQYPALRRGAQRTLSAPGERCRPPSSTLDPAADFGDALYVRGSFDSWANPPPSTQRFANLGGRQYEAAVTLVAATHDFKIAAADWSPEFTNTATLVVPGVPTSLSSQPGTGTNARLAIAQSGCYTFQLNANSLQAPLLTVLGPTAVAADADVLAYARTMNGERSLVVVVNNQRTAVDLAAVSEGGVPVAGLLNDGSVADLAGSGTTLEVNGGRLRGLVPALTAVVL